MSAYNERDPGLIPGSGRSSEGNGTPLPGKSHGWRSLVGYSLWGRKELDTTERLQWSSGCVPRRSNSNGEAGDPASTNSQIVHWRNYISKHNSLSVALRTCKTLYNLNLVSVFSTWHWLNYSMPRKYAYLRIIRNTFAMRWQTINKFNIPFNTFTTFKMRLLLKLPLYKNT